MKIRYLKEIEKEDFVKAIQESKTKSQAIRNLGFDFKKRSPERNATYWEFDFFRLKYDVNIDHFTKFRDYNREIEIRICPVCKEEYPSAKEGKEERKTCSTSCANTFFRSGPDNPNWKENGKSGNTYRSTCFNFHEKKCIICGEENIVSVHHYDHNHYNASPENLIPLCPTHHQYVHSRYAHLVEKKIEDFRNQIINKQNSV